MGGWAAKQNPGIMPTSAERRKAQRFPLDLPLNVKWGKEGQEVEESGEVRDISASGVYFRLSSTPTPESKLELYVRLKMEGAPEGGVLLHCVGTVMRIDSEAAEQVGVAARIDRYRFLRPGAELAQAFPEKTSG
jgi:hypothetical protein